MTSAKVWGHNKHYWLFYLIFSPNLRGLKVTRGFFFHINAQNQNANAYDVVGEQRGNVNKISQNHDISTLCFKFYILLRRRKIDGEIEVSNLCSKMRKPV